MAGLSLGLDSSTQGIKGVLVDIESRQVVWHKAIDYRADSRLKHSGINEQYILPPTEPGQANQPVAMYFASLDAFFADMKKELPQHRLNIADIAVINVSGQQHGHALLNRDSVVLFARLRGGDVDVKASLADRLSGGLAAPWARIWRTSCTEPQAQFVRKVVGGKLAIIEITGSDAPLRFIAFGIRKTAQDHPDVWQRTHIIHQISSLIPAVLAGSVDVPLDYGNACGTSLMDYRLKQWSAKLLGAVADRFADGDDLRSKLPPLASGMVLVGTVADYFVKKYGLDPRCAVGVGSGDNPQTKVLVKGSLLSLGTSFVNMVETDGKTFDKFGFANAMYDAFDRPFMFGCRTNGALRWDDVRSLHKLTKNNYKPAEQVLQTVPPGNFGRLFFWQSETESFPVSGSFGPVRVGYDQPDLAADYAGIIESTLASVYHHSCSFMAPGNELYVAGGATESPEILRRVAAIWNRNVIPIEKGGAALGAAVSGAYALLKSQGQQFDPGDFGGSFLSRRDPIAPRPDDVAAYHADDGFLKKFALAEADLIAKTW